MAPVTEIVVLSVKADSQFEDPAHHEGKTWQGIISTILDQDGAQRLYWGREIENPTTLRLFIDWDSIDDHQKFTKSDSYDPFLKSFMWMVDGGVDVYHASLSPHPPTAAMGDTNAPVTEIINIYFPISTSQSDLDSFEEAAGKLHHLSSNATGLKGVSSGQVIEDVHHPKFSSSASEKFRVYVSLIGWESVDAHTKYRETSEFKETVAPIFAQAHIAHGEMVHIRAKEVQRG